MFRVPRMISRTMLRSVAVTMYTVKSYSWSFSTSSTMGLYQASPRVMPEKPMAVLALKCSTMADSSFMVIPW